METAYIQRVPEDVLNQIFEHSSTGGEPIETDSTKFQITISHVCRLWRYTSLANPLLWNRIKFEPGLDARRRVGRYLELSVAAPLDIYISLYDFPIVPLTDAFEFLRLVKAETHRWRWVHLRIPSSLTLQIYPLWKDHAPLLEYLSIHASSNTHTDRKQDHLVPLPTASNRLQVVHVGFYPASWDTWTCHSITELSLGPFNVVRPGPTARQLSAILGPVSQRLRSLALVGSWQPVPDDDEFNNSIVLSSLTSLTIHTTSLDGYALKVIAGCQFPVLRNLSIQIHHSGSTNSEIPTIFCTPPYRFEAVRDLSIGLLGAPVGMLADVVQVAFPSVETVRTFPYNILVPSLASFIARSWPSMTKLVVAEAEVECLKRLVNERSEASLSNLKSLHLKISRGAIFKDDYDFIGSKVDEWKVESVRPTSGWVYPAMSSKSKIKPFKESEMIRSDLGKAIRSKPGPLFQQGVVRQL